MLFVISQEFIICLKTTGNKTYFIVSKIHYKHIDCNHVLLYSYVQCPEPLLWPTCGTWLKKEDAFTTIWHSFLKKILKYSSMYISSKLKQTPFIDLSWSNRFIIWKNLILYFIMKLAWKIRLLYFNRSFIPHHTLFPNYLPLETVQSLIRTNLNLFYTKLLKNVQSLQQSHLSLHVWLRWANNKRSMITSLTWTVEFSEAKHSILTDTILWPREAW